MPIAGKLKLFVMDQLLDDTRISRDAKHLYQIISAKKPGSISELSRISGIRRSKVRSECLSLAKAGWITTRTKSGRKIAVAAIPHHVQSMMAARLKAEREVTPRVGEFLMKSILDLLVADCEFIENARPAHLDSIHTNRPLEYDRQYLEPKVAFEFNGRQHYETTSMFPKEDALREQQIRDHIKVSLSVKNNVTLIVITEADLTIEGMREKIGDLLPLREIDESGPYVRMLITLCQQYILICRRLREKERKNAQTRAGGQPDAGTAPSEAEVNT